MDERRSTFFEWRDDVIGEEDDRLGEVLADTVLHGLVRVRGLRVLNRNQVNERQNVANAVVSLDGVLNGICVFVCDGVCVGLLQLVQQS